MNVVDARVRLPQDQRIQQKYTAPAAQLQQYDRRLHLSEKLNSGTMTGLLTIMADEGIGRAAMHAESEGGEDPGALNDALARVISEYPERFVGFGCVDPTVVYPRMLVEQTRSAHNLGFVGVSIQPAFAGIGIDDRRLYPVYACAEELGLVAAIHTGINYSRMHPIRHERPELLDQVACDFPGLRIIASHAGWPWASEYAAVALRHPTVFLEFGGLAPRYVSRSGTGWDALFGLMPNLLQDQILYGSDWPVISPTRALDEWRESGLDEATLDALLWRNATRLLEL